MKYANEIGIEMIHEFTRNFGGGWTRTSESRRRGIYSPLQLPLCETPRREKMLAVGVEPTTYRLQGGCSAIELCQHSLMYILISVCMNYHQASSFSDMIFFPKNFEDREETAPEFMTFIVCLASPFF